MPKNGNRDDCACFEYAVCKIVLSLPLTQVKMRIYSISLGLNNVYVLNYRSTILIDGGPPNKWQLLRKGLEKVAIRPEEIQLLVLTHGHWDHIGSAAEISDAGWSQPGLASSVRQWYILYRQIPPDTIRSII